MVAGTLLVLPGWSGRAGEGGMVSGAPPSSSPAAAPSSFSSSSLSPLPLGLTSPPLS